MYKPVYTGAVVLDYPFNKGSAWLHVPDALWTAVVAKLGSSDWTYLRVRSGNMTEIVKVLETGMAGYLLAMRGYDDTIETSFPVGAFVDYVDTVAGVMDTYAPPVLNLSAAGALDIYGSRIHYPLNIEASNPDEVIGLNGAHVVIGRKENAYGCCK